MSLDELRTPEKKPPGRLWRMVRFFLYATFGCGLFGGLAGVVFVLIGSMVEAGGIHGDTGGWAVLFFLSWGFAGLLAGGVIGIIGTIVIALGA